MTRVRCMCFGVNQAGARRRGKPGKDGTRDRGARGQKPPALQPFSPSPFSDMGPETHVRCCPNGEPRAEMAVCRQSMKIVTAPEKVRRTRSAACAVAVCGAIGLLAGCATEPESYVVSAPPPPPPAAPATVYAAPPAYPPAQPAPTYTAVPSPTGGSSIVVMQAPPAAQQEIPSARPSADHVWVPGFWTWRTNRYEWTPGHWEIPPRVGAVWVPPRWQPEGSSWRFYEGYWD